MPETAHTLGDIATLVRSKNAGLFMMTLDVFFDSDTTYEQAAAPGVLTVERIAAAYRVDPAQVELLRLRGIRVIKVSFPRPVVQGSFHDRDMHAGQHHLPLADLTVPVAD